MFTTAGTSLRNRHEMFSTSLVVGISDKLIFIDITILVSAESFYSIMTLHRHGIRWFIRNEQGPSKAANKRRIDAYFQKCLERWTPPYTLGFPPSDFGCKIMFSFWSHVDPLCGGGSDDLPVNPVRKCEILPRLSGLGRWRPGLLFVWTGLDSLPSTLVATHMKLFVPIEVRRTETLTWAEVWNLSRIKYRIVRGNLSSRGNLRPSEDTGTVSFIRNSSMHHISNLILISRHEICIKYSWVVKMTR